MVKIGSLAPYIMCEAVFNGQIKKITLDSFKDQYKILFFYPLNFTFVCPTELHALQDSLDAFTKRNTAVLAISVDSVFSHLAWLEKEKKYGGIVGVTYPLLSDIKKSISHDYGVINEELGVAFRGTFILDKQNLVQYASVQNLGLGRNTSEMLRIIDALIHTEEYGEVCPANWSHGKRAMETTQQGLEKYFEIQE